MMECFSILLQKIKLISSLVSLPKFIVDKIELYKKRSIFKALSTDAQDFLFKILEEPGDRYYFKGNFEKTNTKILTNLSSKGIIRTFTESNALEQRRFCVISEAYLPVVQYYYVKHTDKDVKNSKMRY